MNKLNGCGFNVTLLIILMGWAGTATYAGAPVPAPVASGPHPEHQLANLGDFRFENDQVVKDFKVSYVTYGMLNEAQDNVVLAMHAFTQDHHGLDYLIGAGKALDPEKYFIVATDVLGNSQARPNLTSGPTNSGLKMNFPRFTIGDEINLEVQFVQEYLGFDSIRAAIGNSNGGMKTYQLAVSHPDFVKGIVPIAGTTATHARSKTAYLNMIDVIVLDAGWHGGQYELNPTTAVTVALLNHATRLYTTDWYLDNLHTSEDYLQWKKMWHDIWTVHWPQDARDVYYQLVAIAEFDIGKTPGYIGDRAAALQSIKAKTLIISAKEDPLNFDDHLFAKQHIPDATVLEIDSPYGHTICCGLDPVANEIINREIAKFLDGLQ